MGQAPNKEVGPGLNPPVNSCPNLTSPKLERRNSQSKTGGTQYDRWHVRIRKGLLQWSVIQVTILIVYQEPPLPYLIDEVTASVSGLPTGIPLAMRCRAHVQDRRTFSRRDST